MMTLLRFATYTAIFFMSSKLVIPSAIPAGPSSVRGEADSGRDDNIFNGADFTEDFASETVKSSHSNFPTSSNTTIIGRQKRSISSLILPTIEVAYDIMKALLSGRERKISINNMQPWAVDVECRSGDDNLGWKTLQGNQGFWFKFSANIWGTTHFWCTVKSEGINKAFAVYNEGAPNWKEMRYNLRNEGIYLTDDLKSDGGAFHSGW